jgi:hypothetical protein
MYPAAALLPLSLPRSEMVISRPPSGAGEAPVRRARWARIEGSSMPAAAAPATSGGSKFEASSTGRAVVPGASPVPRPSGPQPGSAPRASTKTRRSWSMIFPHLIVHPPFSLPPLWADVPRDPDIRRGLLAGIITEHHAFARRECAVWRGPVRGN